LSLSREKLILLLISVPRYRLDLLPFYSRIIATLHPYIPEIGATVMSALYRQFKRLVSREDRFGVENRVKNVRFIGELCKFHVCPVHVIFYCFKRLVMPEPHSLFTQIQAEVACHLLDSCGRFMLKDAETSKLFGPLVRMTFFHSFIIYY
jgi:regulator of nonsense transcripts 2